MWKGKFVIPRSVEAQLIPLTTTKTFLYANLREIARVHFVHFLQKRK